jgi:hypothetical protein
MTKFDELKERYPNLIPVQELRANVSIIELAIQYGYEPQLHKGRSRPVLEHPSYNDTIIIKNPQDPAQQVYQRAGDFSDSGTIIDFIRNRLATVFSRFNRPSDNEFKNITSVLYDYLRIDPEQISQNRKVSPKLAEQGVRQPFTKEQFDLRPLDKENYLTQRHIAPQTLNRPEFLGKVVAQIAYFDPQKGRAEDFQTVKDNPDRKYLTFTNVAFPYFNGQSTEVTGLELRNDKVKLHAAGSDRFSSIFVSNPPPKTERFYIMESAIDALSHLQLRNIEGDERYNAVYFSTGGQLTHQQVNTMARYIGSFEKSDNFTVHLGFDNDAKGHLYDLQLIQQMSAVQFPMSTTVAPSNRVAYLLPEQESYRPIRDALLERIDLFNKDVQAQFVRQPGDQLGEKELSNQLVIVSRSGQQVQISIPQTSSALSAVSKLLLDLTGLQQRIQIDKSCAKDFNLELSREVQLAQKYRYAIKDETGKVLINGNSALQMARTLQQMKHQAEGEKADRTLVLLERQPFGFLKPQVEIQLAQGVSIKSIQTPEFNQQIQQEKQTRSQVINPDTSSAIAPVKESEQPGRTSKHRPT